MPDLEVLHVVGSPTSRFHADLSVMYARDVVRPAGTKARFARVDPGGLWRFGDALDALGDPVTAPEAIPRIGRPDVVVPHLFCPTGMVAYRALFEDVLELAVVGARGAAALVATDKTLTRAALAGTGVHVPAGTVHRGGGSTGLQPPFVVKPAREDNSRGLTLVRDASEADAAFREARRFDNRVLVERFVDGREFRVAVLERDGALHVPAVIEYPLDPAHPIRTTAAKLDLTPEGSPERQPAGAEVRCPAPISPQQRGRLADAARRAHVALEGRDYSLFDFRVEARTGSPFLIEACSFWSFSRISMITRMLEADGLEAEGVAYELWRAAASRGPEQGPGGSIASSASLAPVGGDAAAPSLEESTT